MNIDKIDNNKINNIYNKNFSFKEGDILTGHIKDLKNDLYTINLDNKTSINVSKDKIVGNIDDIVYFKVEDNKNTLKQITNQENENFTDKKDINNISFINKRSLDNITEINKSQQYYKKFLDKNNQPSVKESILYTNKIKNNLSHLSNTITEKDLDKFQNIGINPKNIDVTTFSDYLNDSLGIDKSDENTLYKKTLKEIKEEKEKSMKMDLNMNGIDEEASFRFEDILSNIGLLSTDKNISKIF